jgi:hypothetical protein
MKVARGVEQTLRRGARLVEHRINSNRAAGSIAPFATCATLALCLCATPAAACGAPITAEEIMHGRIPTEDNLPCRNDNRAPPQRQVPVTQRQSDTDAIVEDFRRRMRKIDREIEERRRALKKSNEWFDEENRKLAERTERERLEREIADAALRQAQTLSKQNPAAARAMYQEAADAYRRAGDIAQANAVLARMRSLVASAPQPVPRNHASSNQGARSVPPAPPMAQPVISPNPNPGPPPQYSGQSQSASCSDITGLGGSPAATNCKAGDAALTQAQNLYLHDRAAARAKYQEAADAYRRAGDIAMANAIIAQMNALIASAPRPAPNDAGLNQGAPSMPAAPPAAPQAPAAPPQDQQAALPPAQPNAAPADDADNADSCPEVADESGWHDAAYCAKASRSCVDRGSALYGALCYPKADPVSHVACPPGHTDDAGQINRFDGSCWPATQPAGSPITFDALNAQALAQCGADLEIHKRRACIAEKKLAYLLANDPNVRSACAPVTDHDAQLTCADEIYLFGPNAPWKLLASMRGSLASKPLPPWIERLTPQAARVWERLPGNPCAVGQAVQPPQGGGVWTCQPLADLVLRPDQPDAQPPTVGDDDAKMQNIATLIATVTAPRAGAKLKPKDRAICLAVAYHAVLAQMKGGRTPVPPMCQAVVVAAVREFASYADHEFYTGSRGIDRLLAVLDTYYQSAGDIFGADLGAPQPGLSGLAPSADDRRQADCIVAGGSLEDCAKGAK